MDKSNKRVFEYIEKRYSNIILKYKNFESLSIYSDISFEKIKKIFAYFHDELNMSFDYLNQQIPSGRCHADNSREMIKLLGEIEEFQENLKDSIFDFEIDEQYKNQILNCNDFLAPSYGSDIPADVKKITIVKVRPIFKLKNKYNEKILFEYLIDRLTDKDKKLGELFQSKIEFNSYKDNILTWTSYANEEDKKILKSNLSLIQEVIQEVYGEDIEIKDNKKININENKEKDMDRKDKFFVNNNEKQKFSNKEIKYNFPYKNILLKGVTGTGKSRIIDKLIDKDLNLKNYKSINVLKINIHSASSNSDLMQGIAINSNENGNIEYKEKKGLILEFIEKATFNPNQPFVLVLEEIQENSLNELIGDLIYLIEEDKRAKGYKANNQNYLYSELIDEIITQNKDIASVKLPNLISKQEKIKQMIIPHNLFIFCTSNYRDDRKVIEDNLLRRFEVIEVYPKYKDEIGDDFKNEEVSKFLKELNESIIRVCSDNGEIHPDRFMIGHSIWLKVEDKKAFSRAFLKVITEFKDIKDIHFDDFKNITDKLDFPFGLDKVYSSYEEWIKALQKECYNFLSDK